jgi:hypothetical protein
LQTELSHADDNQLSDLSWQPNCMVESTRHALNLFVILVGDSSKARKGTSWNLIANLFAAVDPSWFLSQSAFFFAMMALAAQPREHDPAQSVSL